MTTIADLINEIEVQLLHHYTQPRLDTFSATLTTASTSATMSTTDTLSPGAILDCGYELMYVSGWVEGSRTATLLRGLFGTTASQHATTDLVRINPRLSTVAMLNAIKDELRSWDDRVFTTEKVTVTFGASDHGVGLSPAADPYRILHARPRPNSANSQYKWMSLDLRRGEATAEWSTTWSVHLPPGVTFGESTVVDLLLAEPFTIATLASTTDLNSTVGLTTTQQEILKWGALYRLLAGMQEARLDPFGSIRADLEQSVPATSLIQTAAQYQKMRDQAYNNEALRLLARYPYTAENS